MNVASESLRKSVIVINEDLATRSSQFFQRLSREFRIKVSKSIEPNSLINPAAKCSFLLIYLKETQNASSIIFKIEEFKKNHAKFYVVLIKSPKDSDGINDELQIRFARCFNIQIIELESDLLIIELLLQLFDQNEEYKTQIGYDVLLQIVQENLKRLHA